MAYTYYKFSCVVCGKLVTESEYFDDGSNDKVAFESCDVEEDVTHCGKTTHPIPFRGKGSHPDDDTGERHHCGPVTHMGGR